MPARRVWIRGIGVLLAVTSAASACAPRGRVVASASRGPMVTIAFESAGLALVNPPGTPPTSGTLRTLHALQYIDVRDGFGELLLPRQCVYAHYTGWLPDGTKFDSSRDTSPSGEPRQPISFPQGGRRVIAGWDAGFDGMRVGGLRRLVIPFPLAYGEAGSPPTIPPRTSLVFDVELLAVRDTMPREPDEPVIRGAPARCAPWREVSDTMPPPLAIVRHRAAHVTSRGR